MFLKKIAQFLVNLFHKSEDLAAKYVVPAVKIVDSLVNSPFTGLIENLIPGDLDKQIIDKAKEILPKVVQSLSIASQCAGLSDPAQIVDCFLAGFGQMDPDGQKAIKHSLASLLSHHLSDQKISWSDAVHLAEAVWMELHGNTDLLSGLAKESEVTNLGQLKSQEGKPADPAPDSHAPATVAKDESQADNTTT